MVGLIEDRNRLREEINFSHSDGVLATLEKKSNVDNRQIKFRQDHAEMAEHQRTSLCEFVNLLKREAAEFKLEVADMQAGFRAEHAQMAESQRASLAEFVLNLAQSVADVRAENVTYMALVHQAFFGMSATQQREYEAKEQREAKASPDDLTRIPGVGGQREQALNAAGIYTFLQLANSTPASLESGMSRVDDTKLLNWIKEAKVLASQYVGVSRLFH